MSNAGPGLSPNKQSATGKVSAAGAKKIFAKGGVKSAAPKAPLLRPGQSAKITGK